MILRAMGLLVASALGACVAQVPRPAVLTLTSNTEFVLPSGARITGPGGGWSARQDANGVSLSSPEGIIRVDVVDVDGHYETGDAAIEAAWKIAGFGRPFPVEARTEPPPDRGWDSAVALEYLEPPNDKVAQSAVARRKGTRWTVLLSYGPVAELAMRDSQARIPRESLAAPGYQAESFAGRKPADLDANRLKKVLAFVRESQELLKIPGVGLSIWQHGKPVFEGGLGVRDIKTGAKVDADTRFMIASNTKALSTLLLAKQVDAGSIRWTDKVVRAWPEFRLGDEATTQAIEIRHLVCACTGMPRRDFEYVFRPSSLNTPAEVVAQTAQLVPTSGFGALFQYNNELGAMSGYLAGRLYFPDLELGAAYDRAMQQQLFDPLGMSRTTFDYAKGQQGNSARPYGTNLAGTVVQVDDVFNRNNAGYRPTGGAWSTPRDVMRYLQMELRKGQLPSGERLIGEAALLQRRVPNVPLNAHAQYAMSLVVADVGGIEVIDHGGSVSGFLSNMIFVPSLDLAIVVLTNSDNGRPLIYAMARAVLEVIYDARPEAVERVRKGAQEIEAFRRSVRDNSLQRVPDAVVSTLARRYRNEELGEINLFRKAGQLWLSTEDWTTELRSRANDDGTTSLVFAAPWVLGQVELVTGSEADTRTLVFHDAQRDYTFRATTTAAP